MLSFSAGVVVWYAASSTGNKIEVSVVVSFQGSRGSTGSWVLMAAQTSVLFAAVSDMLSSEDGLDLIEADDSSVLVRGKFGGASTPSTTTPPTGRFG
jgi:hypothetical protein